MWTKRCNFETVTENGDRSSYLKSYLLVRGFGGSGQTVVENEDGASC
jgi:hypothetical protein